MSPGATFERVYHDLRRMLAEGALPPGTPIEPASIGHHLASSITPVRDALHRLTGERLVEAPDHNGFRVPLPTEAALRDLYGWNGLVLGLAARQLAQGSRPESIGPGGDPSDVVTSTAALFMAIAQGTGSAELSAAVGALNDRLAIFRRAEAAVLESATEELTGLAAIATSGSKTALARALTRYHRRRVAGVTAILAHLTYPASS